MKIPNQIHTMTALCACFVSSTAFSQSSSTENDNIYELNPFAVTSAEERSYGAKIAPTATRLASDLGDLPMNVNVMSHQFIEDMNESDTQNLLSWNVMRPVFS